MSQDQTNEGGDRAALRRRLKSLWNEYRALDILAHHSDLERWRKANSLLREMVEVTGEMAKQIPPLP